MQLLFYPHALETRKMAAAQDLAAGACVRYVISHTAKGQVTNAQTPSLLHAARMDAV